MTFYRPTWVQISRQAFAANLKLIKKKVGSKVQLLAVLKADAYGHDADALAPVALRSGAGGIGVSSLEEGIALRQSGIRAPILILGGIYPLENLAVAARHNLTPTISSLDAYLAFKKIADRRSGRWTFHLKVDTGMSRLGVSVPESKRILRIIAKERNNYLTGLYTHFSTADSDLKFMKLQLQHFEEVKSTARALGFTKLQTHAANSAALFNDRSTHQDLVRPGLALYGAHVPGVNGRGLQPVLSWHTKVVFLKKIAKGTPVSYGRTYVAPRERVIATLPVGYADGVPRRLSNRGEVLIQGRRCPIVGRVTMDQIMVDVTGLSIKVGESVILIGAQSREKITVMDWAKWAETVPYEIFCGISKRVPRKVV